MTTHRPPLLRRTATLAVAAILAAATLTGCGDSSDETGSDPSSELSIDSTEDAETDLPEGVPTEQPEAPTESKNSPAGAKAFATYAFHQFQYASLRNDLSPFLALGECPSCDNNVAAAKKRDRKGTFEAYDKEFPVHSVSLLYEERGVKVYGVSYDLPQGKKVDANGKVLATLPGHKKKFMEIAVEYRGKKWRLVDLAITD